MFRLVILFCCIIFCSCQNKGNDGAQAKAVNENDSLKLFSAIIKDSAYFIRYQFSKRVNANGIIDYVYNSSSEKGFAILCDTASKSFKLITNGRDTSVLSFETDRFYTVNGKDYKVVKLISDKGVTDGEVSYFISPDFGLLLNRSNTWRIGKVLSSEKDNSNENLQLTALLYKLLTDEEFFKNPIQEPKIKFTPPKVE